MDEVERGGEAEDERLGIVVAVEMQQVAGDAILAVGAGAVVKSYFNHSTLLSSSTVMRSASAYRSRVRSSSCIKAS